MLEYHLSMSVTNAILRASVTKNEAVEYKEFNSAST